MPAASNATEFFCEGPANRTPACRCLEIGKPLENGLKSRVAGRCISSKSDRGKPRPGCQRRNEIPKRLGQVGPESPCLRAPFDSD